MTDRLIVKDFVCIPGYQHGRAEGFDAEMTFVSSVFLSMTVSPFYAHIYLILLVATQAGASSTRMDIENAGLWSTQLLSFHH